MKKLTAKQMVEVSGGTKYDAVLACLDECYGWNLLCKQGCLWAFPVAD